jgi:hypothetical protein
MGFQMKTQIRFSGSRRENGYIGIRFRVAPPLRETTRGEEYKT